ncbi:7283_t:CDS:2, partial [Ambispora gerdemannii]
KDSKTKNSESFRQLQRTVFQRSLTILLKPILNCPELQFVVRRNVISFIPRISVILADLAEVNKFTNVYQPSTSKKPCSSCLISKINLNNTELTDLSLRTPQNMKQEIENGQAHENSIHTEHNIFWEIS